ncbi:hypothetical protein [Tessaracoccus sp.]
MTTNAPPTNQQRRRRLWLASGAAAVIILLAVILFFQNSSARRAETPMPPPGTTTGAATDPMQSTTAPTDQGTTPPVMPSDSPNLQSPSAPTPQEQPTKNEDSAPRETQEPVKITAEATPAEGITVRLVLIEPVEGIAAIPGEVGGPALRITVEVTNNTKDTFAAPAVVVNLYKGEALSPAGPMLKPGGVPFPNEIPSGRSATGVYLFTVGPDERDDVTVEVDLAVGTPIVLFQGPIS